MAKYLGQYGSEIGQYFESFKKMPDFLNVLDGIIKLQCKTTCQESGGCSLGVVTHECEALRCIRSKRYDGCWDCAEVGSCEKLTFLKKNYGETVEGNLRIIKDEGIEAVKSRGNKYYARQRKSDENNYNHGLIRAGAPRRVTVRIGDRYVPKNSLTLSDDRVHN